MISGSEAAIAHSSAENLHVSVKIRLVAGAILALMVLIPAWGLILSGHLRGRGAHDQLNYHEPAIVRFAADWPRPDVSDYLSATSPGYHLVLAGAAQVLGDDRLTLQLLGSLFSGAMFAWIGFAISGTLGVRRSVMLALPLLGSMYVFYPAVWLLPDNAAWLGVIVVLWLALRARRVSGMLIAATLVTTALVFTRQIHLWVLGPVWTACYLGSRRGEPEQDRVAWDIRGLVTRDPAGGLIRVSFGLVLAVAPCGVLAILLREWGGLTPPLFQGAYHGGNPAAPAFILALFGLFAPFYMVFMWPTVARTIAGNRGGIVVGAAIGLVASLAAATTYSTEAGRYSGLWNLTRHAPVVAERSVVIVLLATIGGALLMAMLGAIGRRDRWVIAAAIVGFIAAQSASHELWQRYTEPFVLLVLTMVVAIAPRGMPGFGSGQQRAFAMRTIPVALLGILLGAMTCVSIARARSVKDLELTKDAKYAVPGWSMPPAVTPFEEK